MKKSKPRQSFVSKEVFTHYVALGDSISTDDYPGKGKGGVSLFFKNQDRLYPEFRNRDLHSSYSGIELVFLALDGATTSDVLNQQVPALKKIESANPLFTLTAGGNDLLSLEAGTSDLEFGLDSILATLLRDFPTSKILLGTIYDPTDGVGDLMGPGTIVEREMRILHEVNEHIRSLSKVPQIEVVDIYQHFLGHGSHYDDPSNPYYHLEDPTLWFVQTIEPNERGGHEVRKLFWDALERRRLTTKALRP